MISIVEYDEGTFLIERLYVAPAERNCGRATAMMGNACDWADDAGMILVLDPSPLEPEILKERLMDFYRRFDFEVCDDGLMRRSPQ